MTTGSYSRRLVLDEVSTLAKTILPDQPKINLEAPQISRTIAKAITLYWQTPDKSTHIKEIYRQFADTSHATPTTRSPKFTCVAPIPQETIENIIYKLQRVHPEISFNNEVKIRLERIIIHYWNERLIPAHPQNIFSAIKPFIAKYLTSLQTGPQPPASTFVLSPPAASPIAANSTPKNDTENPPRHHHHEHHHHHHKHKDGSKKEK